MPLRGRVGRHTRTGGQHCQNWPDDQQTVTALLNRIPVAAGGASGSLIGPTISGIASDALYRAITQFEDQHFLGQRSGFVDPGGALLKRMEELAARTTSAPAPTAAAPVAETPLDILRRNVLDDPEWYTRYRRWYKFEKWESIAIAPLVTMAVRHIDALKDRGFDKIPWPVELFGRAHVHPFGSTFRKITWSSTFLGRDRPLVFRDLDTGEETKVQFEEMRFGSPVSSNDSIWTEKLPALLLYVSGQCCRVRPWHTGRIRYFEDISPPDPWDPGPK